MKTYVIENKDNERFEVDENELEAFLKQKNLRWSRLKNTWDGWERNDPRKWERDYKISEVLDDGFDFSEKEETVDVIGKTERKPKYTTTETGYLVHYGENKSVHITEEELSKFRKLYCGKHSMTIEQMCLEFNMTREECYSVKTAFSIVKQSIPFTDKEIDELSVDEMAEISRIEKKKAYFRKLEDLKVEDMERELKKLHQKDYYWNKAIDSFKDINVVVNTTVSEYKPKDDYEFVVVLSDIHAGMKCDNVFNTYNVDVMKRRFVEYKEGIIKEIELHKPNKIIVVGLGDMLNGIIHVSGRVNSDLNVINSLKIVTEEILKLLISLSNYCKVEYMQVLGNHSRVISDKTEAIYDENFEKLIEWYLGVALKSYSNITITHTTGTFVEFDTKGFKIIITHGDDTSKDEAFLYNTNKKIDLILKGHWHSYKINTIGNTEIVTTGSMCGVDEYAIKRQLYSKPSQLIVALGNNGHKKYIPIYFK